jgi:hypothetical protein
MQTKFPTYKNFNKNMQSDNLTMDKNPKLYAN